MLEKFYGSAKTLLLAPGSYNPFPSIDDRGPWEAMTQEQKDFYLTLAEGYLGYEWPVLPAVRYLDYVRNANRSRYTKLECKRRAVLMTLAIAECIENKGRFLDDFINGFWATLDEASWVGPAHNGFFPYIDHQKRPLPPTRNDQIWVDHFAGDTGCLMAALGTMLRPRLDAETPMLYERLCDELHRRIINPFLMHDNMAWMGNDSMPSFVNNWTTWVVSNILAVTNVISLDADTRAAVVEKSMKLIDKYMDTLYDDGGCEEGSRYWSVAAGALFGGLELLEGMSGGAINAYDTPKLAAYTTYITKNQINGNMFTTFADSDRYAHLNLQYAWSYAQKMHNPALAQLALYLRPKKYSEKIHPDNMHMHAFGTIQDLFTYKEYMAQPDTQAPYERDGYFGGIQLVTARQTEGSVEGLYFAAHGGHNDESHNHNDVGTFLLASDGCPCIIDMGAGDYTANSFNELRYIVNKQCTSAYHNLPMAGEVQQQEGREFQSSNVTYECTDDQVRFGLNIEKAYAPETPIDTWRREYTFDRKAEMLTLVDTFKLKEKAPLVSVLMTALKPEIQGCDLIVPVDSGRSVKVTCPDGWTPEVTEWDVSDNTNYVNDWNGKVYRTLYHGPSDILEGTMTLTFKQI